MGSITEKKCNVCQKIRNVSEFYTNSRPGYAGTIAGYMSECKSCHSKRLAKKMKETYTKEVGRELNLKRNHGITNAQFQEMYKRQDGKCPICKKVFENDKGGRNVHVDHSHATGKIRSLLCNNCNIMLGQANEKISILESAIAYLEQHESAAVL